MSDQLSKQPTITISQSREYATQTAKSACVLAIPARHRSPTAQVSAARLFAKVVRTAVLHPLLMVASAQSWNNILQPAIPIVYWSGLKDCIVDWNVVQ